MSKPSGLHRRRSRNHRPRHPRPPARAADRSNSAAFADAHRKDPGRPPRGHGRGRPRHPLPARRRGPGIGRAGRRARQRRRPSCSTPAPRIASHPDWTYGFPELSPGQAGRIADARKVANPGCYPTGAIALLRPLVDAGLLPPDYPVSINAVSGYSGGGRSMIEAHERDGGPAFELYALGLEHKHMPETAALLPGSPGGRSSSPRSATSARECWSPFRCTSTPCRASRQPPTCKRCWRRATPTAIPSASSPPTPIGKLEPEALNGTNLLELSRARQRDAPPGGPGRAARQSRQGRLGRRGAEPLPDAWPQGCRPHA